MDEDSVLPPPYTIVYLLYQLMRYFVGLSFKDWCHSTKKISKKDEGSTNDVENPRYFQLSQSKIVKYVHILKKVINRFFAIFSVQKIKKCHKMVIALKQRNQSLLLGNSRNFILV